MIRIEDRNGPVEFKEQPEQIEVVVPNTFIKELRDFSELYEGPISKALARAANKLEENLNSEKELRHRIQMMDDLIEENYWIWQGDGNDEIETLCCSVLISPGELSQLITGNTTPLEVAEPEEREDLWGDIPMPKATKFPMGRYIGPCKMEPEDSDEEKCNPERPLIVNYITDHINQIISKYFCDYNDQTTRDSLKADIDEFLSLLVTGKDLFDFSTTCDESNNTPERIDNHEIHINVVIKLSKNAEFIFIPCRLVPSIDTPEEETTITTTAKLDDPMIWVTPAGEYIDTDEDAIEAGFKRGEMEMLSAGYKVGKTKLGDEPEFIIDDSVNNLYPHEMKLVRLDKLRELNFENAMKGV